MTYRDFYTAILNAMTIEGDNINATELQDFAKDALAKLDERNAKRSSKPSKTAVANAPIKESILELLAESGKVASDIATVLEISTQKASALCLQLENEGKIAKSEVKVPKKGKVKFYSLVVAD